MEDKDFKDEQAIKYWLHYFRRNDIPELTAAEIDQQSESRYQALMQGQAVQPVKSKKLWYATISAAAAVLLVIGISLYYKSFTPARDQDAPQLTLADIAPGKNSATLILASGLGIQLSNVAHGKIAEQTGVAIFKTADDKLVYKTSGSAGQQPQMNTILTAKGEQYQVDLPDGTKVWLNAASSVKFPATFASSDTRTVELSGEAYFEVAKDSTHPFIVKTDQQVIKVLGTHFNVNSYADEPITKTTLLEGAVKVSPKGEQAMVTTLKPGEQSQLSAGIIKVKMVDLAESMAWKHGDFNFDNEEFSSILKQVSRWYNVEIVDEGNHDGLQLSGMVSRSKNLSTVLKSLEVAGKVKFKTEGKKVIVID